VQSGDVLEARLGRYFRGTHARAVPCADGASIRRLSVECVCPARDPKTVAMRGAGTRLLRLAEAAYLCRFEASIRDESEGSATGGVSGRRSRHVQRADVLFEVRMLGAFGFRPSGPRVWCWSLTLRLPESWQLSFRRRSAPRCEYELPTCVNRHSNITETTRATEQPRLRAAQSSRRFHSFSNHRLEQTRSPKKRFQERTDLPVS